MLNHYAPDHECPKLPLYIIMYACASSYDCITDVPIPRPILKKYFLLSCLDFGNVDRSWLLRLGMGGVVFMVLLRRGDIITDSSCCPLRARCKTNGRGNMLWRLALLARNLRLGMWKAF